ncbi:MAG: hypothetical protein ACE5K4_05605 [Candidatus Hydrothermarchaeota archaeon]
MILLLVLFNISSILSSYPIPYANESAFIDGPYHVMDHKYYAVTYSDKEIQGIFILNSTGYLELDKLIWQEVLMKKYNRSLTAWDYYIIRKTENRIFKRIRLEIMLELIKKGMRPTMFSLIHDLTSDIIHDNPFLWRMRVKEPKTFLRLPRRLEG